MNKAERLLKILTILQSRRRAVTATALAEMLQVSERTIYRDVQALGLSGVPIDGEAGVGDVLQKGSVLPPLMFTEDELEALILGVRMVQGWGDEGLGSAADSALDKIRAILPQRQHYLNAIAKETLLVPDYERTAIVRFSQPLRESIKRFQKVRLDYSDEAGKATGRIAWPLGLVYWGKVWTLIAWCELRSAYRMFRLDRINSLELLAAQFEPQADRCLKDYLERFTGE